MRTSATQSKKSVLVNISSTYDRSQSEEDIKPAALFLSGINVCHAAIYLIFVDSVCIHLNLVGLLLK